MADEYKNFEELSRNEDEGVDFEVDHIEGNAPFWVVLAIHGGRIEPVTCEIAKSLFTLGISGYCFRALVSGGGQQPHPLHLTSTNFDDPRALALVEQAGHCLSFHGRRDGADPETVWIGGLDKHHREALCRNLLTAGFEAEINLTSLPGTDPENICNKTSTGQGVQLEIPRRVRTRIARDPSLFRKFREACELTIEP